MTWYDEFTNRDRTGIALALYPFSDSQGIEIQRAPDDGSGDPDTGNAVTVLIANPGVTKYIDLLPLDGANRHYRTRHVDKTATESGWTNWVAATPVLIPDPLPPVPSLLPTIDVIQTIGVNDITFTATSSLGELEAGHVEFQDPERALSETGSITAAGTTLTLTGDEFLDEDLNLFCSIADAGPAGGILNSRIASVTAADEVELEDAATGTVSGKAVIVGGGWYSDFDYDGTDESQETNTRARVSVGNDQSWIMFRAVVGTVASSPTLININRKNTAPAPQMTIATSQPGSAGLLTITVWDPGLFSTALSFQVKDDAGDYGAPSTAWDTETGVAGTDETLLRTENIFFVAKHNVGLQVTLAYTEDGENKTDIQTVSFDSDLIPEIQSIAVSYDSDGTINVHPISDEDGINTYITVGVNSTPSNPTALSNDGTIATRTGTISTSIVSQIGDLVTVKAVADDVNADLGPVFIVNDLRSDSANAPPEIALDPTQSATTGSFDMIVTDLALSVTALDFQVRAGAGAWSGSWVSTWDRSTGTPGTNQALTRGEDVSLAGKHTAGIKARITYTDQNGAAKTIDRSHTFDLDLIAEITAIVISFNADNDVIITLTGDEDTDDMYVTAGTSSPSDPTVITNDGTVAGRTGTVDTGVTVVKGETAFVKAVAADGGAALGPVATAQFFREEDPASLLGTLADCFDDATDLDWSVSWTKAGSTNSTDNTLTIQYMIDDVMVEQETGVSVDEGQPYQQSTTGAGGLPGGELAWVNIILMDNAAGAVATYTTVRRAVTT